MAPLSKHLRRVACAIPLVVSVLSVPAEAAEVGDVVFLSKGAGLTLTSMVRINRDSVALIGHSTQANSAEFCRRYENLRADSPKWRGCIRENVATKPTTLIVNCQASTIILTDGEAAGIYRPSPNGGPWFSSGAANSIIVGDDAFDRACKRR